MQIQGPPEVQLSSISYYNYCYKKFSSLCTFSGKYIYDKFGRMKQLQAWKIFGNLSWLLLGHFNE